MLKYGSTRFSFVEAYLQSFSSLPQRKLASIPYLPHMSTSVFRTLSPTYVHIRIPYPTSHVTFVHIVARTRPTNQKHNPSAITLITLKDSQIKPYKNIVNSKVQNATFKIIPDLDNVHKSDILESVY